MKYLRIVLILLLVITFTVVSCKKNSTGSNTDDGIGALAGTWTLVELFLGEILTTNSNQTALNPWLCNGSINISGAVSAVLDYMQVDDGTNPVSFEITQNFWTGDFTAFYYLTIDNGPGGEVIFSYFDAAYNYYEYRGNLNYTFDGTTLTLTQATLTDPNTNNTVTVSGTISIVTVNVPANNPTFIQWTPDDYFEAGESMTINDDGTYGYYEDQISVETGTVVVEDDRILYITTIGGVPDTFFVNYTINGDNLMISYSEDACADPDPNVEQDCLSDTEDSYDIADGSLIKTEFAVEQYYTRTAARNEYLIDEITTDKKRTDRLRMMIEKRNEQLENRNR